MFVSAYLEAANVLPGRMAGECRSFALKTVERMLREVWSEEEGFAHRIGGPALRGSLDDQVFGAIALLDAYEATLDRKYFKAAQRTMDVAIEKYGDAEGGVLRPSVRCSADGRARGSEEAIPGFAHAGSEFVAITALTRVHAYTDDSKYHDWTKKTLEAFAGAAPQFGLFASTYGLAAVLFAQHPTQVVVTGAAGDAAAQKLQDAAQGVFRLGKAVLRVTPESSLENLPAALRLTLPHLPKDKPAALVCTGATCQPPVSDPDELKKILQKGIAGTAAG